MSRGVPIQPLLNNHATVSGIVSLRCKQSPVVFSWEALLDQSYLVYINDLPSVLVYSILEYLHTIRTFLPKHVASKALNTELKKIKLWCNTYKLSINFKIWQ